MGTRHALVETVLGAVTLVADGGAVTGVYFRHHVGRPGQTALGPGVDADGDVLLAVAAAQLREYLDGRRRRFELPVRADGDPFQHAVWDVVAEVPYGETTTYGRVAGRLGDSSLAYRVGQAVGANPLCVLVPCHRVVGADGGLTGYAGGLKRKRALLELEEPARVRAGRLF